MSGGIESMHEDAFTKQVGGDHYASLPAQPAPFLRANNVPHLEGEAIYRILRHKVKDGRKDLEKAIHTLQLIIELDYPDHRP
jgi:hypothetical protein